ncbi:RDD family protein [Microbacterium sp.]|uniref:RDD family protein n=1 Tax=Microbacterium sp. TaxID=51671 RepID=UPI002811D91F|nr:RDD family protein [Microbacterium sp.]
MTMLPLGDVAPIRRRAIAYIIDAAIGGVVSVIIPTIAMIVVAATSGSLLTALVVAAPLFSILGLAWLIVYTIMQAGRGSIGMRTQGIRLANATDGAPLGFGRALLRNVIWGLAASIVVGYFTVLFDGSGRFQGWHDKVAGAVMLDDRSATGPAPYADSVAQVVPDDVNAPAAPPSAGSMPGFAMPADSMPGFAQPANGFAPPAAAFARPPVPDAVPAAAEPAASAEAAALPGEPADDEFTEHTVLSPPRISRDLPDDPLISFVPGVTQEPLRRTASPEPAPHIASEPALPSPPVASPAAPASAPAPPTVVPAPAEPSAPAAPVVRSHASEDDDAEDIESTRISVPGHRLVFTWDDGQRATVSGRTVFGRNPEDGDGATNVSVRDETRSLSKTHFEAGATASGGWVMDRQSTNGTTIVREGVRIACPPGQRVPVRLGDALEIGDRIVTIGGYV